MTSRALQEEWRSLMSCRPLGQLYLPQWIDMKRDLEHRIKEATDE